MNYLKYILLLFLLTIILIINTNIFEMNENQKLTIDYSYIDSSLFNSYILLDIIDCVKKPFSSKPENIYSRNVIEDLNEFLPIYSSDRALSLAPTTPYCTITTETVLSVDPDAPSQNFINSTTIFTLNNIFYMGTLKDKLQKHCNNQNTFDIPVGELTSDNMFTIVKKSEDIFTCISGIFSMTYTPGSDMNTESISIYDNKTLTFTEDDEVRLIIYKNIQNNSIAGRKFIDNLLFINDHNNLCYKCNNIGSDTDSMCNNTIQKDVGLIDKNLHNITTPEYSEPPVKHYIRMIERLIILKSQYEYENFVAIKIPTEHNEIFFNMYTNQGNLTSIKENITNSFIKKMEDNTLKNLLSINNEDDKIAEFNDNLKTIFKQYIKFIEINIENQNNIYMFLPNIMNICHSCNETSEILKNIRYDYILSDDGNFIVDIDIKYMDSCKENEIYKNIIHRVKSFTNGVLGVKNVPLLFDYDPETKKGSPTDATIIMCKRG